MDQVAGLLLAAGSGSRMGEPKALLAGADGRVFVRRCADLLREAGCDPVLVTTGAAASAVAAALDGSGASLVPVEDWELGMGASLRAGLRALDGSDAAAVLVMLVDLPDVGPAVLRRLLDEATTEGLPPRQWLARATFTGGPGHPVLIGRDHWAGVVGSADGDRGARDYLEAHDHLRVECGDLGSGADVDTPEDLGRAGRPG